MNLAHPMTHVIAAAASAIAALTISPWFFVITVIALAAWAAMFAGWVFS